MDSMEIDDDVYINKNLTMEGLITKVDFQRKKQPSRCVNVCLGLLCAVLLAGNIAQIIYYQIISHFALADPAQASYSPEGGQLQSSYDALTAERKELEARLSNLTKEKDELQEVYNSVTTERDDFNARFNNLKHEKDQLQASYSTLKQASDQLKMSYNDTQRNLEWLQTNHHNLTAIRDQLQVNYNNLQREHDKLQTFFHRLEGNYSSLNRDREQLLGNYNTLTMSKNHLQISYNSMWKEKEQLKTSYNTLQKEKELLQTNCSSLAIDRDQLQKKIDKARRKIVCQTGWFKFDISCYFVSTLKKNWTLSRQDCITRGADLVAIDGMDEQVFVHRLLRTGQNAWIGLTDSLKEGTWMWVDGEPVTTSYWQPGQPNSYNGNQDCGEMVEKSGMGEWNDDGCFAEQIWICEK
ncbi:C-type lectin domain family 4 member M-like [Morone saxatilis]|uniref:C-type lectin domain family 4 member M-like n=1 Tax=Morone saxatilis TaxID=34816 RepID=UPI0015E1E73D|nr:C-type lectin domain family 4 member M-like [Morone saxatilis]